MTDYIEREAVREALHNPMLMGLGFTEWELDRIPMADAEKVRHARWEAKKLAYKGLADSYILVCSECKNTWMETPYCPHCGARMDLEASDG